MVVPFTRSVSLGQVAGLPMQQKIEAKHFISSLFSVKVYGCYIPTHMNKCNKKAI